MRSTANIAVSANVAMENEFLTDPANCGWLVIENDSALSVAFTFPGIGNLTVPGQYLWPVPTNDPSYNWDGSVSLMPSADMTISNPPSSFIRYHIFRRGEYCPVQSPQPVIRSTNVGGGSLTSNIISPDGGSHSLAAVYDAANARMELQPGGSAGVHPLAMVLTYVDAAGVQRFAFLGNSDGSGGVGGPSAALLTWDNAGNVTSIGNHTIGGVLASLAGQATVGPSGVPPIVRRTYEQHVVATAVATIAAFAPPANGLYRVQMYGTIKGTANGTSVSANVNWQDPNGGGLPVSLPGYTVTSAPVVALQIMANLNLGTNTATFSTVPLMLDLLSGVGVNLTFHDAAGTVVSDFISATIEGPF